MCLHNDAVYSCKFDRAQTNTKTLLSLLLHGPASPILTSKAYGSANYIQTYCNGMVVQKFSVQYAAQTASRMALMDILHISLSQFTEEALTPR